MYRLEMTKQTVICFQNDDAPVMNCSCTFVGGNSRINLQNFKCFEQS